MSNEAAAADYSASKWSNVYPTPQDNANIFFQQTLHMLSMLGEKSWLCSPLHCQIHTFKAKITSMEPRKIWNNKSCKITNKSMIILNLVLGKVKMCLHGLK